MAPQGAGKSGVSVLRPQLLTSRQTRLRQSAAGLLLIAGLAAAAVTTPARGQSFVWGGAGSSTSTVDYNLNTNWSNPPAGAPPVAAGQSAIFNGTGSDTVAVTAVVAPDSWTFDIANFFQPFLVSGSDVKFSLAGAAGGLIVFNTGQKVSISNNIGETVAGVQVQLFGGGGGLLLSGVNTYTGGTNVAGGTLLVSNGNSVGTGLVTLQSGLFQVANIVPPGGLTFTNNFAINNTVNGSTINSNGSVLTISGNIVDGNGPGMLFVLDSANARGDPRGLLTLLGTNTYTGGTGIQGTLQLGDATHTASLLGDVFIHGPGLG